ncbi:MAG: hypothetical protein ISP90_07065 [Nevskia sp.]|nr:hypothetical protein [Nevskia sp.]
MSEPCPKCGYLRQPQDAGSAGECPRCGVIYAKYLEHLARAQASTRIVAAGETAAGGDGGSFFETQFAKLGEVPERVDPVVFYGSCAAYALFALWGLWFIVQPFNSLALGESFLHRADLPFHEFGHVLFRPFGDWLMFLGGSLFQCLLPLIVGGYFLFWQRQPFSASICLWWAGQNFIDVAPYIADAQRMALPLTGEWSDDVAAARQWRHDWHNILQPLGLLGWDQGLAHLSKSVGTLLMVTSWAWGGMLLRRQWRRLAP